MLVAARRRQEKEDPIGSRRVAPGSGRAAMAATGMILLYAVALRTLDLTGLDDVAG